jgi:hypothetical protein
MWESISFNSPIRGKTGGNFALLFFCFSHQLFVMKSAKSKGRSKYSQGNRKDLNWKVFFHFQNN